MKDWETGYLIEPDRIAVTGFSGASDEPLIATGCEVSAEYITPKDRWVFHIRLATGHSVYLMAPSAAVRTHMRDEDPFRDAEADAINLGTLVLLP